MNSQLNSIAIRSLVLLIVLAVLVCMTAWNLPNRVHRAPILMIELCDNAIDDDGDGLVDLNDEDCECPVIEPESLIPNPSFEEMNCCPNSRSQLHCADTWIQASEPTTDYLHTCGWMGWPEFPPPLPFPDGVACVGFRDGRVIQTTPERNWKEYAGACLLSPLKRNTAYRFEFYVGFVNRTASPPINITFFGTPDCDNLPFGQGDAAFGCPTNGTGWVRLGSVGVNGNGWVKSSIDVAPDQDIYAMAIGPDCPGVISDVSTYYFFDNLVLADQRSFDFQISPASHPCDPDLSLQVPTDTLLDYQWYKEGVALVGETAPSLSQMYGEGNYQVRMTGDNECNVTRSYHHEVPVIEASGQKTICAGDALTFGPSILTEPGEYTETFKSVDQCDSIVTLQLNVQTLTEDTIHAQIFRGESFRVGSRNLGDQGEHLVPLLSSIGCDSLVRVFLQYYDVYFPNVFSPNGDGRNDYFIVHGGVELISVRSLTVFDRWGAVVYEQREMMPNGSNGWDGQADGKPAPAGVYLYRAVLLMNDGKEREFNGAVTILR